MARLARRFGGLQPELREGTLYIAVIDPHTKHRIWVGAAQGRIVPTMSLERKAKRVDAATHAILADFPPR